MRKSNETVLLHALGLMLLLLFPIACLIQQGHAQEPGSLSLTTTTTTEETPIKLPIQTNLTEKVNQILATILEMATDIKEEGQTTIQKVMDNMTRSEQYDRIRAYTTEQWTKLAQRLSARREQLNKLVNDMLEQIDGKVNEMSGRSDQAEYAPQWDRIKQILRSVRNSFNYFLKPEGSGTLTVTSQVQGDGMRESSTVTITKGNGTSPITGSTAQGELRDMTASLAQLVQELDAMQALGQAKMANKSQEASRK